MRTRVITSWRSTIAGALILAFLAFAVHMDPKLLDRPESLLGLMAGLAGIFWRDKTNGR